LKTNLALRLKNVGKELRSMCACIPVPSTVEIAVCSSFHWWQIIRRIKKPGSLHRIVRASRLRYPRPAVLLPIRWFVRHGIVPRTAFKWWPGSCRRRPRWLRHRARN